MVHRSRLLTIKNPFYVRPARLDRSGQTTFKEAVRVYLDTYERVMLRKGIVPSDKFDAVKKALDDFAGQMDTQAAIKLKVKK